MPSAAHREGLGHCVGGRRLDKCPPSSACGGRLLLYFVQTPATHAAARLADSRELQPGPPGCLIRGGSGGVCEVKEEAPAAGLRRGTFACTPRSLQRSTTHASTAIATRAAARLADSREPQPGPPGCLTRGGSGGCVRSKGGGAGRRPAPGDIRTQPPLPPALDQPASALRQQPTKNAAPMFRRPRQERRCRGRGRGSEHEADAGHRALELLLQADRAVAALLVHVQLEPVVAGE